MTGIEEIVAPPKAGCCGGKRGIALSAIAFAAAARVRSVRSVQVHLKRNGSLEIPYLPLVQSAANGRFEPFANDAAECSKGGETRFSDIAVHGTVPIRPFVLRLVAETYGSQSRRSCLLQQICIGNDRVAGPSGLSLQNIDCPVEQ